MVEPVNNPLHAGSVQFFHLFFLDMTKAAAQVTSVGESQVSKVRSISENDVANGPTQELG